MCESDFTGGNTKSKGSEYKDEWWVEEWWEVDILGDWVYSGNSRSWVSYSLAGK